MSAGPLGRTLKKNLQYSYDIRERTQPTVQLSSEKPSLYNILEYRRFEAPGSLVPLDGFQGGPALTWRQHVWYELDTAVGVLPSRLCSSAEKQTEEEVLRTMQTALLLRRLHAQGAPKHP